MSRRPAQSHRPGVTEVAAHPHHHGPVHLDEADWQEFAAQTELEGEMLIGFVTGTVGRVKALRGPEAPQVHRVLDIGSGPGVGTCELARLFPGAHVVAVDGSPAMLSRVTRRADEVASAHASAPTSPSCPVASTASALPT